MTSLSKEFDSWMTTYYPDKKHTWVTLWYVEKWTDKKGKKDSLYYTDDVLLKNGKIMVYDEKKRRFPEPVVKKQSLSSPVWFVINIVGNFGLPNWFENHKPLAFTGGLC